MKSLILKHSIRTSFASKIRIKLHHQGIHTNIRTSYTQLYDHPKTQNEQSSKLLKAIMRQNIASHMYPSHATSTVELSTRFINHLCPFEALPERKR